MPFKHLLDSSIKSRALEYAQTNLSNFMIDLFLSEACNLRCKHCYFGSHTPQEQLLTTEQWISIISDLVKIGCRHIHFSGKESLLSASLFHVVKYLDELRKIYPDLYWGFITNGTSVTPEEYSSILKTSIGYLEISLDGGEKQHDYIRGLGTFGKVLNTISKLNDLSKVNIAYTISQSNSDDFSMIISRLYMMGIKKFYCSPLQIKGRALDNQLCEITPKKYIEVIEKIKHLLSTGNLHDVNVKFSLPSAYVTYLMESDIYLGELKEYFKSGKKVFWKYDSNVIELSLHTISIPLFAQASITSDGQILASSDKVDDLNNYGRYTTIDNFMKLRSLCIIKYFK